jgi:hypothetical protein
MNKPTENIMNKPTENIINNIYVICTPNKLNSYTGYNKINNITKNINTYKWFKQKSISDDNIYKKVRKQITNTCNLLCTDEMIIEWICHVSLWQKLYINKNDRTLVLNEMVIINDNFMSELESIWNIIPYNWDIIFLNKKCKLDGYIISLSCINKIMKSKVCDKIGYCLLSTLENINNLNMYSLTGKLVKIKDNQILAKNHLLLDPLLMPIFGNINESPFDVNIKNKKLGKIKISNYFIFFSLISFLVGYINNNNNYGTLFMTIVVFQQIIELGFFKITNGKLETLTFEIIAIIICYYIGKYYGNYIKSSGSV